MSPFFDDLERQLREAARVQAARDGARGDAWPRPRRATPRRPSAGWLRHLPAAAAVLVTAAVVAIAVIVVPHHGGGSTGSAHPGHGLASVIRRTPAAQLRRELTEITSATAQTRDATACQPRPLRTTVIPGTPGPSLLRTFGVLRRPVTTADRLAPGLRVQLQAPIYEGATRLAVRRDGISYYLVAGRTDPAATTPPPQCFALQRRALRDDLRAIPARLRASTIALQRGLIAYVRRLASRPASDAICTAEIGRNSSRTDCGLPVAQIRAGIFPSSDEGTFSGVVPDGVASVTVGFGTAGTFTTQVTHNVYVLTPHLPAAAGKRPPDPTTLVWRAPDGHVLKRQASSGPAAAKRFCAAHPVECLLLRAGSTSRSSGQAGSARASSTTIAAPATRQATAAPATTVPPAGSVVSSSRASAH